MNSCENVIFFWFELLSTYKLHFTFCTMLWLVSSLSHCRCLFTVTRWQHVNVALCRHMRITLYFLAGYLFITLFCSWFSDLSSDSQLTATAAPDQDSGVTLHVLRNMESQRAQKYVTSTHEIGVLYTYFTNTSHVFHTCFTHILHVKYLWTFNT